MDTITLNLKPSRLASRLPGRRPRRLHLEITRDHLAVITFDHPDKSVNVFDETTLHELEIALRAVEKLKPQGLIFTSSKPAVFVAGADLKSLSHARGDELRMLVESGQRIFNRISDLGIPTIAAIHGACLGGGLELALACDRRIASDDSVTKLGFPETLLGILPAWGGSTRLPRLLGLPKALDLILSGKQVSAGYAAKLGLVDEVVPKERLLSRARILLKRPAPERHSHFLTNNPLSAAVIRCITDRRVIAKTRGNYPAQSAAVKVVSRGACGSAEASLVREADAVIRLAETETAKNLMRLHFLQESAKHSRFDESIDPASLTPVRRTAVIGAGVMGSGIAQWFAARRYPVILRDIDPARVAAGMKTISKLFAGATAKRIFSRHEAGRLFDLVSPSATTVSLDRCDLVVEAAVENLEIKKKIFAELCSLTSPGTILATNTSALPISSLCTADGITHPERIIGLHFFNPVNRMKLVEVVVTEFTSPETVERALSFVHKIGKLPVVVKDSPGFLVNRILMPYLIEAGRMVEAGISPEQIDEAMLDFGMPMGPLRLLDEVGLDVATHVAGTMSAAFGNRFQVPEIVTELVARNHLGKKSGVGFYSYPGEKPAIHKKNTASPDKAALSARLTGLMVHEARQCLAEGIARSADEIDLAMVLGTGFAPFRGGPLAYAESAGEETKSFNLPPHSVV
jgi:3-hydroxyacyl-CoA dehydrogenase/enoyl-CoA hydratase/3-hydroxybutyryl-CoA epimerase